MVELPREHLRAYLLHACAIGESFPAGDAGLVALLDRLDVIQLDPIDRVGQNADLVASARVSGIRRGDVHRVLAGRSFEHFAKERCIVHARHFAHYRHQAVETPWWRSSERMQRVDEVLLSDVYAEIVERGPLSSSELTPRGKAEAIDWSGWKGTGRREVLALEVLWTRCQIVVSGRDASGRRRYGTPGQLLGIAEVPPAPKQAFGETILLARVCSAGLLARAGGPTWSMLSSVRTDGTVERLLAAGKLVEVRVGRRPYLALPQLLSFNADSFLAKLSHPATALAPLDPLLWDRALIAELFDFEYVWEIYKPAAERRWGYYVLPVLSDGQLVGRIEARREGESLKLEQAWGPLASHVEAAVLDRLVKLNESITLDVSRVIRH